MEPIRYNQGERIRDTVMNNLMQAHKQAIQFGTVKEIITLSKFILKLSKQFNKEVFNFGLEKHNECADYPPKESKDNISNFECDISRIKP